MATTKVTIPANTWTEVATASTSYQVITMKDVYVTEASSAPTGTEGSYKIAEPKKMYDFTRVDGNLYAYSVNHPAEISIN